MSNDEANNIDGSGNTKARIGAMKELLEKYGMELRAEIPIFKGRAIDKDASKWRYASGEEILGLLGNPVIMYHMGTYWVDLIKYHSYYAFLLDFDSKANFSQESLEVAREIYNILRQWKMNPMIKFSGSSGLHFITLLDKVPADIEKHEYCRFIYKYIGRKVRGGILRDKSSPYSLELKDQIRGVYSTNYNSGEALYSIPLDSLNSITVDDILRQAKCPAFRPVLALLESTIYRVEALPARLNREMERYNHSQREWTAFYRLRPLLESFIKINVGRGVSMRQLSELLSGGMTFRRFPLSWAIRQVQTLLDLGVLEKMPSAPLFCKPEYNGVNFGPDTEFRVIKETTSPGEAIMAMLVRHPPADGRKQILYSFLVPYLLDKALSTEEVQQRCEDWIASTGAQMYQYRSYIASQIQWAARRRATGTLRYTTSIAHMRELLGLNTTDT